MGEQEAKSTKEVLAEWSGVISAFGTCFAAFAAALSAYAAFRQERATFTADLYQKQIEFVGAFQGHIDEYIENSETVLTAYENEAKNSSELEQIPIEPINQAFLHTGVSLNQMKLVLPADYSDRLDAVAEDLRGVDTQLHRGLQNFIAGHRGQNANADADMRNTAASIRRQLQTFFHEAEAITDCSYKTLSDGRFIEKGSIGKCKASPRIDWDGR